MANNALKNKVKPAGKKARASKQVVTTVNARNVVLEDKATYKDTIPGRFLATCEKYPENDALLYKKDHTFGQIKYKRLRNLVENFTLSLQKLGIKKGDKVVLISENRPEWVVADLSVKSLGAILIPIHKTLTTEQISEIFIEVEPKLYIVSDSETFNKVQDARKNLNLLGPTIYLDIENIGTENDIDFITSLKLITHEEHSNEYLEIIKKVEPSNLCAIMYKPGECGKYKGVMLTHKNLVSNVEGCKEAITFYESDRFLSVLPMSHAFEKTTGYYIPLFTGSTVCYLNEMTDFSSMLKSYKPTVIMGVPRLFEKSHERIARTLRKNKFNKYFFNKVLTSNKKDSSFVSFERILKRRINKEFGGELRICISGGAALKEEVGYFFRRIGIELLQGYGLTETGPVVSVNPVENNKVGTVGKVLPNTEVRIALDGEILVKGPNVMSGYIHNEKLNKEVFDGEWLKTGDYGEFDRDAYLRITGKKKRIIVLSTGKNISPVGIEKALIKSRFIKQAVVEGDGQKSISAKIYPDYIELEKEFSKNKKYFNISALNLNEIIKKEIDEHLIKFSHHERVKNFRILRTLLFEEKQVN